jgi:MFS family permease
MVTDTRLRRARRSLRSPFAVALTEWTVCNVGHWAVMGTLSLYLVVALDLEPFVAGALFTFASFAFRLTRFFTAAVVSRLSPRQAVVGSMLLGAAGYSGIALTSEPVLLVVFLPLVGAGYGSNELVVKSLAAKTRERSRILRYASINTGLNVAAAVGPLVGNTVFLHWEPRGVFVISAAAFGVAALAGLRLPSARPTGIRTVGAARSMGALLREPLLRHVLILIALGFLLYAQLFATLPLATHSLLNAPEVLGGYFVLNAVLAGAGQVPINRLAQALGAEPDTLVRMSYGCFAAGFALLWLVPRWEVGYASVALWTLGEILLGPAVDTLLAGAVPAGLRILAFTLAAGAMAVGEGLGALTAIPLAGYLAERGQFAQLYLALLVLAIVSIGVAVLSQRAATRLPTRMPGLAPPSDEVA